MMMLQLTAAGSTSRGPTEFATKYIMLKLLGSEIVTTTLLMLLHRALRSKSIDFVA